MEYDVLIIGAGPAGLAAGIYAGRAKLRTLIVEMARAGGQIAFSAEVANYPGGIMNESGQELADRMRAQCESFDADFVSGEVTDISPEGDVKTVSCGETSYSAKTLILAMGSRPVMLGVPGEAEFVGRGVSYCATCDAPFFTGLEAFVVGGGDSAVEEALHVAKFARKVTIIHRRDSLRAAKSIQDRAFSNERIEFLWDTVVRELRGGDLLSEILIENVKTGEKRVIKADDNDGTFGFFVFIGLTPHTKALGNKIALDKGSYILTDDNMRTNVPGVFAAGDIRAKSLRQVVTAAADGAISATQAEKYLEGRV